MALTLSTWTIANAAIVKPSRDAKKDSDPVLILTGTVTKDGESQKQKQLKVTLAQSKDASLTIDLSKYASNKIVTVKRNEVRAGRPAATGMAADKATLTLASLGIKIVGLPEPTPAAATPAADAKKDEAK